jgi:hypothetical protein
MEKETVSLGANRMKAICRRSAEDWLAMKNIEHNAVYIRNGLPLITLCHWPVAEGSLPDRLFDATEQELLSRTSCIRNQSFVGSYLLGLEFCEDSFPCCAVLLQYVRSALVQPLESLLKVKLAFSFIKYAAGMPPPSAEGVFYEGEHLDSHPGLQNDLELFRVLFNVARTTRLFRYRETDSRELLRQGISTGRSDFRSLSLPSSIKERVAIIPGRNRERICGLCFWASMIPHVGVNTNDGYFLISYEGVMPFPGADTQFSFDRTAEIRRLG